MFRSSEADTRSDITSSSAEENIGGDDTRQYFDAQQFGGIPGENDTHVRSGKIPNCVVTWGWRCRHLSNHPKDLLFNDRQDDMPWVRNSKPFALSRPGMDPIKKIREAVLQAPIDRTS